MIPAALSLSAAARAVIVAAARSAWPREACGLLSGADSADGTVRVDAVHPTANVAPADRPDRFEVDPAARFALMRRLRGGPSRLIGHFHSHPGHPAVPSETDRRAAYEPDLLWLIVGLSGADDPAPVLAAWAVQPGSRSGEPAEGFHPVDLRATG
ncbi:M67 family metallopeptidase [Roseospira marina]|uniref:M67 family metallopeptidase n=1 Tax=Roseospira marina TaxID=140057 RepID=A0A5M6IC04_9PROT|nr:M67 family metallopeptidase [Roseospira marina]KAA5605279.1 M67 family metallopeptidase [Roseospira marina]MBB4314740.1 proteasome lid subunit RPN8/RPN11 [Roseospira marina]MBB5087729.1 proteasome lid subunit RPN8/RPN11 [Roseospira marina]